MEFFFYVYSGQSIETKHAVLFSYKETSKQTALYLVNRIADFINGFCVKNNYPLNWE